jgi:hypothetical protein
MSFRPVFRFGHALVDSLLPPLGGLVPAALRFVATLVFRLPAFEYLPGALAQIGPILAGLGWLRFRRWCDVATSTMVPFRQAIAGNLRGQLQPGDGAAPAFRPA